MSALSKLGVAHGVVFLAVLALSVSAQAQTFHPDSAEMSGTADDPTFNYGDMVWTCDTATLEGVTGADSDTLQDVVFDVQEPCNISGLLDVTVDCGFGENASTTDLIAQDALTNTSTIELNDDFRCVFTLEGVCNLILAGPQTTQDNNLALDTTADRVTADLGVRMINDGSEYCGPPSGFAGLDGVYHMTPSNLDIVP